MQNKSIKTAFNKAASSYDSVAVLQREIAQRMIDRLQLMRIAPKTILDLGAGTGYCSGLLQQAYPDAQVIAVDFAMEMLANIKVADRLSAVCSNAMQLPLVDSSCDFVFANFMLPWCLELPSLFAELQRVLVADGLLMFSTLGPDTLKELKHSWLQVDAYQHINPFFDMHDIGDVLLQSYFIDPVMDREQLTLTANDPKKLLLDLKASGSLMLTSKINHGLTTPRQLQAMLSHYRDYQDDDGRFPATFEVLYGHAWGSNRSDNEVLVSVDSLRS